MIQFVGTFALSKSTAFMRDPWKYLIRVCCLFSRPSSSKSGSALRKGKCLATVDKVFSFRQTVMAGAIKTFSKSLTQNPNPLITVFGTEVPNFLTLWMMKTKKNYVIKYVCSMQLPVQEDNLNIIFLSVLMQEVLEEVRDRLVSDVSTHNNMSEERELLSSVITQGYWGFSYSNTVYYLGCKHA